MPIFSSTPARSTLPPVGASTWASGSQVWKGTIGTLTAKPANRARNTHHCSQPPRASIGSGWAATPAVSLAMSKESVPVWEALQRTIVSRPKNASTLPARV